jgi:hypothetical protein
MAAISFAISWPVEFFISDRFMVIQLDQWINQKIHKMCQMQQYQSAFWRIVHPVSY